MYFRQLQQEIERDRKKSRHSIGQWMITIIFIGSIMFSYIFWCYLIMWFMLLSFLTIIGFMAVFKKKLIIKEPFYKIKAFFVRLFLLSISVGGLTFFLYFFGVYKYFLDNPNYIHKNEEVISGFAEINTSPARGFVFQSIKINGVTLDNRRILPQGEFKGKWLEIHYLPRSKFVTEIWY